MLNRLTITNFILIKQLDLDFHPGFTTLTGETGAGKSILIDAIQFVLGARASIDLIRENCNKAEVYAEFSCNQAIEDWLQQTGCSADGELFIKRQIDQTSKSKAWINGSPVSSQQLKQLAPLLLNIHGQHAWQNLLQPANMRRILDDFAQIDLTALHQSWQIWQQKQQLLQQLSQQQNTLVDKQEQLEWRLAELNKLAPQADEWQQLHTEHDRLSNAQNLLLTCAKSLALLDEDSPTQGCAISQINKAIRALQEQQHKETQFSELTQILEQSSQLIQEVSHSLQSYLANNEPDPQRLEILDQRLSLWLSIARRFKIEPSQVYDLVQQTKTELTQLEQQTDLTLLQNQCEQLQHQWLQQAQQVSKLRHLASPKLAQTITNLLQQLGMSGCEFNIELKSNENPSRDGLESIQFLIANHKGTTGKAIQKIASGGELSRIALAISTISMHANETDCLIFDEVDTGVGGQTASTIGQLMQQLGSKQQVLCITHLAQVAGFAQNHLYIEKNTAGSQIDSAVSYLNDKQRIAEIARMLGSNTNSTVALAHAKQILANHHVENN